MKIPPFLGLIVSCFAGFLVFKTIQIQSLILAGISGALLYNAIAFAVAKGIALSTAKKD